MGLRNLPSKTWQVNAGWVIAANIAADLAAWTRLLGCCDDADLREADPDTLRYRIWHIPARLARHARQRTLNISPGLALEGGIPHLLAAALRPARTRLTSTNHPTDTKGGPARRGRSRCAPGHAGLRHATAPASKQTPHPKPGTAQSVSGPQAPERLRLAATSPPSRGRRIAGRPPCVDTITVARQSPSQHGCIA